jgi:UPF0042 nucleotide-binding protein
VSIIPDVSITTFGYLHGAPPEGAHITLDLRKHFRDPHIRPHLRYLTARDQPVRTTVLDTPGIQPLISATAAAVAAYLSGPSTGPVTVAVGCAGGRHRAAVVGAELACELSALWGVPARLTHRDLDKDVVER